MSEYEEVSVEEMDRVIQQFCDAYDGTAIGEHIRRWRENTSDADYDEIYSIYEEIGQFEGWLN